MGIIKIENVFQIDISRWKWVSIKYIKMGKG